MKYRTVFICLFIFCSGFIIAASQASAVDLSIGGTAWYAKWNPSFYDFMKERMPGASADIEIDPSYMVGPFASIKLAPALTLSSVFMYGSSYNLKQTTTSVYGNPMLDFIMKDNMKIKKYDMDTTLSYALNGTFKIFGGIKYQGYKYNDLYYLYSPYNGLVFESNNISQKMKSVGPGLGLGITYPVISNLYFIGQASGIYMIGSFSSSIYPSHKYTIYGWNSSMGLAWFEESINTSFSLGIRYQDLKYSKRYSGSFDPTNISTDDPADGHNDIFYGLTMSATYAFTI